MARAVEEPLKQISVNAGLEGGVVVERVRNLPVNEGLNAATGEYEDLSRRALSTPSRSPGLLCKTRRRSLACSSPQRLSSWTSPKRSSPPVLVRAAGAWTTSKSAPC